MASPQPDPMTGLEKAEGSKHITQRPSSPPKPPRRPPAHQSVSLLHASSRLPVLPDQSAKQSSISQSSRAPNPPSSSNSSNLKPKNVQWSSGESSDAGKWFDNSNNNVDRSNPRFQDSSSHLQMHPFQAYHILQMTLLFSYATLPLQIHRQRTSKCHQRRTTWHRCPTVPA
jgi:hypothetical protein